MHKFMIANPGKVVTRYNFSELFHEAWMKSMTVKNILSAFKIAGIQPFDRNAVKIPLQKPKVATSGIKFIPLLTPSKRSQLHLSQGRATTESPSSSTDSSEEVVHMPQFESPVFKTAIRNKAIPTLKVPVPLYKEKDQPIKSRRVLTSKENLEAMEQKQKLKEEEIKIKAERKLQREAKKREKQERAKQKKTKTKCDSGDFSPTELELFQRRFDNGYDLKTDDRYNQWLKARDASSDGESSKFTRSIAISIKLS